MCSDIIFGYSPITQPIPRQTKDLHGGPSLGAAGSNAAFQQGPIGKNRRGAPAQWQDPCPVTATETGRETALIVQSTTCPCQTRDLNLPAPQSKNSDSIWAKQDPVKPVNPGETNLSRLFNWPESRPCPQARAKGQDLLCSLTGNPAEITEQSTLWRAVWNVHLTAHIVAIFIKRPLLGSNQEKESPACCPDLRRDGSQPQKPMPWTYNHLFWLTWGTKTQKGLQGFLSLLLTSPHFKDSQACSVNKKGQIPLEKAASQL